MGKIQPNRTGFVSEVIQPAFGQQYTLEFRKVTGELDHSNSYQVFRVTTGNSGADGSKQYQEYVGLLNELYFYPEKHLIIILSKGEINAISEVMDRLAEAILTSSVTKSKTNP
ncbi:MAG: hypothetical protein Q8O88_03790 [bacterium]|nr:hypothetical protein [bacterium]